MLGTEFNVMAYAADSVWETSLLEGAVEILVPGSNNSGMRLEPNMMASLKGNRLVKGRIKEVDYFLKLNNKFTYTKNDETNVITIN